MERAYFPDLMAPDEVKKTPEFGLQVGKAIKHEWFFRRESGTGTQAPYYDKRIRYDMLRKYARGEQNTEIYKNLLTNGEEASYTNYDWRPIQVLPKFVKMVVNQFTERLFEVRADAVDKYSTDMKQGHRDYLEDLMVSKDLINQAKEMFNVDIMPNDVEELPDSHEEIDLHMAMKYKPSIEIATEESVKFTFGINNFEETQSRVTEDVVVIGIGAVKHITDPNKGIVIKHIDPADMVYAYPKERDFESVHYYGEVERMTVMELKRLSGMQFSAEQLAEMANASALWNTYHNVSNQFNDTINTSAMDNVYVDVLHFTFKAINTLTYNKEYRSDGSFVMNGKALTGNETVEVIRKDIDVWYEGSMVLGHDLLFNYKLCENMIRPEGLLNKTIPNYVLFAPELYQNRARSIVSSVIPIIDQMQMVHIKMQQAIAKSRPNGVYVDVTGLEEVALGDGNFLTPIEMIKIYDETGNVLGSSINADGEYNYGKQPIQELRNGGVAGINDFILSWNQYMNQFRDIVGIPAGADASTPHPDMAVGVQQQLALNSNTATRHILNAVLNITQRVANGSIYRLRDIFKYSDLKEVYINAIGRINVELLNSLKNFHLHDLGILISLKPDSEEKQMLDTLINTALTKGEITLTDAMDIRDMGNIKFSKELLKIRRDKREKEARAFDMQKIQAQQDGSIKAAQVAAQAKMSEYQAKAQSEIEVEKQKSQNKLAELEKEAALKSQLMDQEFQINMKLKGMENQGKQAVLHQTQAGKVALQDRGNSQNSKMIEQRKYSAPSLNFESSEDTLSGTMDMAEVGGM